MISNRPYLLRAFYQWIIDSDCTPIMVIDATNPRCNVPSDFAEGGEIVFNISPTAVRELNISNKQIEFKASFSGVVHYISAPISAILAVYAEENGEGLFLEAEEEAEGTSRAQLRGIDGSNAEPLDGMLMDGAMPPSSRPRPVLKLVE